MAVASLGVAASAAVLTFYQAYISRDTETRQLRAYVSVDGVNVSYISANGVLAPGPIIMIASIKNYGSTPAYKVRVYSNYGTAPPNMPKGTMLPDLRGGLENPTVLFPGVTTTSSSDDFVLTAEEVRELTVTGKLNFYYYGKIIYEDAFENERYTKFCYMFGGPSLIKKTAEKAFDPQNDLEGVFCTFYNNAN